MVRWCLRYAVLMLGVITALPLAEAQQKEDIKYSAEIKKTGLSREKRIAIWKELCAAEDRAIWEANRLFDPVSQAKKLGDYRSSALHRYWADVLKKNKITDHTRLVILAEAAEDSREPPKYPSCDIKQVAMKLKVNVYSNRGDSTYHRRNCLVLKDGQQPVVISIYKAITATKSRACSSCLP